MLFQERREQKYGFALNQPSKKYLKINMPGPSKVETRLIASLHLKAPAYNLELVDTSKESHPIQLAFMHDLFASECFRVGLEVEIL